MIGMQLGLLNGSLSQAAFEEYCLALEEVPGKIEAWLGDLSKQTRSISRYFRLASNVLFAGCGIHFPVALEGALKLKEISYIHAEGFPAAEIKHGALTLVQNFLPVVCIAMKSDPAYQRVLTNHQELKAQGAAV